jgi:hypothetical protein
VRPHLSSDHSDSSTSASGYNREAGIEAGCWQEISLNLANVVSLSLFDPRQKRKDFSSSLCVQNGSEPHPDSCTMGTGGPFPGAKAWPGRDADHSPHLVPRSRMSRSYTSSPPRRLRGV